METEAETKELNAADYGFSEEATGEENVQALQRAVDAARALAGPGEGDGE